MAYTSSIFLVSPTITLGELKQIVLGYEQSSGRVVALDSTDGLNLLALADDYLPEREIELAVMEPGQEQPPPLNGFDAVLMGLFSIQGDLVRLAMYRKAD